jgi:hypothetical protein
MLFIGRVILFGIGLWLLAFTFSSIVRTFVVPRNEKVWLTRMVFGAIRSLFDLAMSLSKSFLNWDKLMAQFAPMGLLALSTTGIALMYISYWAMFMSLGIGWQDAYRLSGSFLLSSGSASTQSLILNMLGFTETVIGLLMVALLVSFLPTIYSAVSQREVLVARLDFRAGSPPSGVEIIARLYRLGEIQLLNELWSEWENWFVEVEESHTSLFALAFFRSPKPHRSWVNASGAVLDAASLALSTVEREPNFQTEMCFQAGVAALCSISDFFDLPDACLVRQNYVIGVSYEQYKLACLKLSMQGVPLKSDSVRAWEDFKKYRIQYDGALIALATLTIAPETSWSRVGLHPIAKPVV